MPTSLSAITVRDRARVGGKAFQLAALLDRGLPIPPGFVVTTDELRHTLATSELLDLAERVHRDGRSADARELAERLEQVPLPGWLARDLLRESLALGPAVAVRSSGIDEDGGDRSFAGQHASFLHVAPQGVADAVRRCWASLYSERALSYRGGRGPAPASIAVLIQRQLLPVSAGVMFTVNPLNGSWREMTVEATWGLGEGIASGHVTPHWYLVRRPRKAPRPVERLLSRVRLQLVQEDLPAIGQRWVVGEDGEVGPEPVPASLAGRATLQRSDLFRLCRMGLRIERHLGGPQDVEWALDGQGLWVLQARPITTTGTPRARQDVLWTRRFLGERWPEPATPLGWSLMEPILDWFIAYPTVQARHLGGGPAVRLVQSRPYLNATVFGHLAFKLPGAPAPRFMLELMPPEDVTAWRQRHAVLPDLSVYGSILRVTLDEKRWRRFRWNPFTNHKAWDAFEAEMVAALPELSRDPVSVGDAVRLVEGQLDLIRRYVGVHVCSLLFANIWDQVLEGLLAAWLPEQAPRLRDALATCPAGNRTLAMNVALHELAALATAEQLAALERGEVGANDSPFDRALAVFLDTCGHRSQASWEVFTPRYADAPERLVPLLRGHKAGAEDPSALAVRQEAAYDVALAELQAATGGTARGWILEGVVYLVRRYLLLRENQRFQFDHALYALQRTLLWLGGQLVEAGALEVASDVAMLTWSEVRGVAQGTLDGDGTRAWVARRRAERQADLDVEPPVFLRGDDAIVPQRFEHRLQGLGISPGRARGRVRLVRTLADGARLQPGEVLVTRAVDPAWTPLFLTASAVVLELGSRLSHGAVVAREYGVPAVVNLDGVMTTLRDGQEVTVDGTRGVVYLHP